MGWDDSDDEWEKADVPQLDAGKGPSETWSDDEDEKEAAAARAKEAADKAAAEKAAAEKSAAGKPAASSAKAPAPAPAPAAAPAPAESASSAEPVDDQAPKTDKDFERLAGLIHAQIKQYEGGKGHLTLLKSLCKAAMENVSVDDAKQMDKMMSTIFNEKVAKEREKDKGKKKAPKKGQMTQGKQTGHDHGGRGGYDDDYDDY